MEQLGQAGPDLGERSLQLGELAGQGLGLDPARLRALLHRMETSRPWAGKESETEGQHGGGIRPASPQEAGTLAASTCNPTPACSGYRPCEAFLKDAVEAGLRPPGRLPRELRGASSGDARSPRPSRRGRPEPVPAVRRPEPGSPSAPLRGMPDVAGRALQLQDARVPLVHGVSGRVARGRSPAGQLRVSLRLPLAPGPRPG